MAAQLRRSRRTGFGWLDFELLERLLEGEIKSRFAGNVMQEKKFSELLANVIKRFRSSKS